MILVEATEMVEVHEVLGAAKTWVDADTAIANIPWGTPVQDRLPRHQARHDAGKVLSDAVSRLRRATGGAA